MRKLSSAAGTPSIKMLWRHAIPADLNAPIPDGSSSPCLSLHQRHRVPSESIEADCDFAEIKRAQAEHIAELYASFCFLCTHHQPLRRLNPTMEGITTISPISPGYRSFIPLLHSQMGGRCAAEVSNASSREGIAKGK